MSRINTRRIITSMADKKIHWINTMIQFVRDSVGFISRISNSKVSIPCYFIISSLEAFSSPYPTVKGKIYIIPKAYYLGLGKFWDEDILNWHSNLLVRLGCRAVRVLKTTLAARLMVYHIWKRNTRVNSCKW